MNILFYIIPLIGIISLFYMTIKYQWITKQYAGEKKMVDIAHHIAKGAMSFLKAEYKILSYFVLFASILLLFVSYKSAYSHPLILVSFVLGALFSGLAGIIGMRIATKANVRTTEAAKKSLSQAFKVSFTGGTVMGTGVTGLAILGLGILFIFFYCIFLPQGLTKNNLPMLTILLEVLTGFSLGAESIALFARVGGGIYTKAADVGADLVGKVESGIPEDDPRNPATIADNVGDNVGDVAGMGADLFGSYVATIVAAMVLGSEINTLHIDSVQGLSCVLLPMLIGGVGILVSIICFNFIKIKKNDVYNVQRILNFGHWLSIIITAFVSFFLIKYLLPEQLIVREKVFSAIHVFYAIITGLLVGALVSSITEYFTSMDKSPVQRIVKQSSTGHATNIIAGLSVGMLSTVFPVILFALGIAISFYWAGFYGVAIAATGMMSTTAMQLAIDAFGPIADNAGGIAEMSGLSKEVRKKTDILDTVGNTTAATGKGFAIASAALTALALFAAFVKITGIDSIDIYKAPVLSGLFLGSIIPFLFSSLSISAVGTAAMTMVEEVRRQFREIKGIMDGKVLPEYEKCIDISTKSAIQSMLLPGFITISFPIAVGFLFGPEVLGGALAGVTVSGVLMAIFQCNAGGAWDNAKKTFEKGVEIQGTTYYKGSDPHKASVTGDTVGDPFKDTSGPSMNILIKLTSIVALVIAPFIAKKDHLKKEDIQQKVENLTHKTDD